MASSLTEPDVLSQAIATNGDKNTIPNTNDQSLGQMSQSTGFPPICSERIADGGKAPRRADFNGAFNLLSQHHFYLQNGGQETFRQAVSDAIGGYPAGAILFYKPSVGDVMIVRSEINNNTYNFNDDPSYIDGLKWKVVTPTLGGNNTWTGDTTFAGNVSFSDSDAKANVASLASPDYSSMLSVASGVSSLSYTAPTNGVVIATASGGTNDAVGTITVNGVQIPSSSQTNAGAYFVSFTIPLAKNDVLVMSSINGYPNIAWVVFIPCFGG